HDNPIQKSKSAWLFCP
ncbi:hypothetical protein SNEBB_000622, partial [Seison nebaliae]